QQREARGRGRLEGGARGAMWAYGVPPARRSIVRSGAPRSPRGGWRGRTRRMLSPDDLDRYARHIVLRDVGGPGQAALKQASVLVIGAGGLGAPALMYLAAAGVGEPGGVDDATASPSQLPRQILQPAPPIRPRQAPTRAAQ